MPGFVVVGEITGAFGLKGDVKVDLLTDFPERFAVGSRLFLRGDAVIVERVRRAEPERMVVKLSGIETRQDAAALWGSSLEIPAEEVAPLPRGSYYRFQLLGLEAWTPGGDYLGTVSDVFPTGSNDVLVVDGPGHAEILIPYTAELTDVDLDSRRLTVRVVPGLLPEEGARSATAHRSRRG